MNSHLTSTMFPIFSMRAAPRRAILLSAVLVAATQACSDSTTGPKSKPQSSSPMGTYVLRTVDSKNLPVQINRSPYFNPANHHFYNVYEVNITKGEIELDELGNITMSLDASIVGDGVPLTGHSEIHGTYQVQGGQVMISINGSPPGVLPIQNGEIDLPMDLMQKGVSVVYSFRR
jgi:hypothetical protein